MDCEINYKKSLSGLSVLFSLALTTSLTFGSPAFAQQAPPQNGLAMMVLPVSQGQNGQQMATTPRGMRFPLPGAGVNGNVVQVYTGPQGGYWYVDRAGNSITLLQPGQQLPSMPYYGQTNAYVPQQQQPTSQTTVVNNTQPQSSGSSAAGAMMAGTAGMLGGMALGAAMDNNNGYYGGVPYGHPVYYGGAGSKPYYYGQGGKPVYVDNSKSVDVNAMQNQQNWYNNTVNNNKDLANHWQNTRNDQMRQEPMGGQGQQWQQGQGWQQGQQGQDGEGRRGRHRGQDDGNNPNMAGDRRDGAGQQQDGGGRRGFRGRKGDQQNGGNPGGGFDGRQGGQGGRDGDRQAGGDGSREGKRAGGREGGREGGGEGGGRSGGGRRRGR